jgi:hypothetical protein
MTSRYGILRTFGWLSIALAVILLILGIVGAIWGWSTVSSFVSAGVGLPASLSFAGALPPLLFGLWGFFQFFVIGKVLHLLVDMDDSVQKALAEQNRQTEKLDLLMMPMPGGSSTAASK